MPPGQSDDQSSAPVEPFIERPRTQATIRDWFIWMLVASDMAEMLGVEDARERQRLIVGMIKRTGLSLNEIMRAGAVVEMECNRRWH